MAHATLAQRLHTRSGIALVLGIVALASVLVYIPTVNYDFVWDDTSLISNNQLLAQSKPWDLFTRNFWAGAPDPVGGVAQSFYRPLTTFTFWLDLKLAKLNPGYFHLINTILGALVAVVVALIIWELFHSGIWAGLGGLLFAMHSSHVESVAFVSGRTDLLLTLFLCIASFALVRSLRKRNYWWWPVVLIGFALALLSKETAILFPLLVAFAPLLTQSRYNRHHWLLITSTLLIVAGYLMLRNNVVGTLPGPNLPFNHFIEAANTFGLYIKMFFWPFAHQVKFPVDPSFANLTPNAILALLFIVTPLLLAIRRRFRVLLFGYAWTILFLLPVTIIAIGPQAAERLLYLPSTGLVIIVITFLSRIFRGRAAGRKFISITVCGLILVLGTDTITRLPIWRNEPTLFATMIHEAPTAPSAYANLANTVRFTYPDSAIRLYKKAIRLNHDYVRPHINIGVLYGTQGDYRQALHHLQKANELRPHSAQVLGNLGLAFIAAGEPESALVYLNQAVEEEPNSATYLFNRSIALAKAGKDAEADSELYKALGADSCFVPAELALIDRFEEKGLLDSAARHMKKVIILNPDLPVFPNRLGTILVRLGDSAHAQNYYLQALKLDSCFVPALYNQSILYAAQGDTQSACELARQAHRLRPDLPAIEKLYKLLKR